MAEATQEATRVEHVVAQGVALVFRSAMRPRDAADRVVCALDQFTPAERLSLVRQAIAAMIESALRDQQRVPLYDVAAMRQQSIARVTQGALARVAVTAEDAARKLDAYYAARDGAMKPLAAFTADDHRWRSAYAQSQASSWQRWSAFHTASAEAIEHAGVETIAALSPTKRAWLEGLVP
jgi:hypothetical protein